MRWILLVVLGLMIGGSAFAQTPTTVKVCSNNATPCPPVSTTNPLPVTVSGSSGGTVTANQGTPNTAANAWPVSAKTGTYTSAGTAQYGLAVATNTTLTVPGGTLCAYFTVETASVRRTSDGTSATTTVGTLLSTGAQWSDCGPLANYKFTAVSGSPTLDVEYFK